ncbi:MAG: hypothetical protein WBE34_11275 [Candidatus Nitrosopolaris sp.]
MVRRLQWAVHRFDSNNNINAQRHYFTIIQEKNIKKDFGWTDRTDHQKDELFIVLR